MLHRLTFDTSDAASIAASANVGAYLRSDDGTLLTHHTVGGDEGLDVYLINTSIAVTATDLDIRDLSHTQDSVQIGDGTDLMAVNGDGSINAVVTATDLDIRDLAAATDSVSAWTKDGTGTAITSTVSGPDTGLDVYLLNAGDIDVDDSLANTAVASSSESVTITSGALITSDLASRKWAWLYNNGNKIVYVGPSGVSTADGFPLFPGSLLETRIGAAVAIHAVAEAGTQDVRVLQAS